MGLIEEHFERRRQTFGLRVAIGILVCYVASAFMSLTAIRYSMYGREVDAIIMKAEYKDMDNKFLVTYRFFSDEDKKWYKKTTSVGANQWQMPAEKKIPVIFMPESPKTSMLVSKRNFMGIYIFCTMNVLLVFAILAGIVWARRQNASVRSNS